MLSHDPHPIMEEKRNTFCKLFHEQDTKASGFEDDLYEFIKKKKQEIKTGETLSANKFRYEVFSDIINYPISRLESEFIRDMRKVAQAM